MPVTAETVVDHGSFLGELMLCGEQGCGTAGPSCVLGKRDPEGQRQAAAAVAGLSDGSPHSIERFKVTFAGFKVVKDGKCSINLEGVSKIERLSVRFS